MQANYANTREFDGFLIDVNLSSQAERTDSLAFLLELGETHLALEKSCFLQRHPLKETLIGIIQVPKCLLHGTFRNSVHPGKVRLLESIQFLMESDSIRTFASSAVDLNGTG
jgi:hypothetical protein